MHNKKGVFGKLQRLERPLQVPVALTRPPREVFSRLDCRLPEHAEATAATVRAGTSTWCHSQVLFLWTLECKSCRVMEIFTRVWGYGDGSVGETLATQT